MKKILLLLCITLLYNQLSAQQIAKTIPVPGEVAAMGFYEYKPAGYDAASSKKYPLIIFLHGNDERGNGTTELSLLVNQGIPKLIHQGVNMTFVNPSTMETESFIVLSPQLPKYHGGWYEQFVNAIYSYAITNLNVDLDRVYLTGLSLGGGGTLGNASLSPAHARRFAALAPISSPQYYDHTKLCETIGAAKLGVWFFANLDDPIVSPYGSVLASSTLMKCDSNVRESYAATGGHDAWTRAYDPGHSKQYPNLYEWFLTFKRQSSTNPTANAGADQTITLPVSTVTLSGNASTPPTNGSITGYSWSFVSGPSGYNIGTPSQQTTSISGLTSGTYIFRLTVTASNQATASDVVTITVLPPEITSGCAAMSFDGNDFVDIKDITIEGDFTFETWIKLDQTGSEKLVVIGQGGGLGQHINFWERRFTVYRPNQSQFWQPIQAKIEHFPGTWKHYALVRKNNILSIYINGQHDTTSPVTMSEPFIPKVIGKDFSSFIGKLDEMRIWDAARTAAQIADNYNKSVAVNSSRLVAYYKFNEDADDQQVVDASGNNNHGRRGVDPLAADASDPTRVYTQLPAIAGDCEAPPTCAAMSFDGNDFIDIKDITIAGNFTFETWIKLDERGSNKLVVIGQGTGLGQHINFWQERFTVFRPNQSQFWQPIQAKFPHVPGTWKHYALVRKDSVLSIYINGQHDTTSPVKMGEPFIPKVIGKDFSSFIGKLDEMRIWDTARTAAQIADNYNKSVAVNSSRLVAYYKFNEAADDQQVIDASPNNNHGTRGVNASAPDTSDPTRVYTQLPAIAGDCGTLSVSGLREDLQETASKIVLQIYPNPVTDVANIKLSAPSSGMYEIRIADINGKLIYNRKIFMQAGNGQTIKINLPATGNGLLIVQVKGNNEMKTEKILRLK